MDPTPIFLLLGVAIGIGTTLGIQAFGRRGNRKAMIEAMGKELTAYRAEQDMRGKREAIELAHRVAMLEQIVTDRPAALAEEIAGLR